MNRTEVEAQFRDWLEQTVWVQAKAQGVSRGTFEASFSGVTLNWELPDLVPPGTNPETPKQQRQSEFGAPAKYFSRGTVDGTTSVGRQMAKRHSDILREVEKSTGVPGRIILAIWERESAYGRAPIRHDAFEVLGTKGFMSTRAEYFTQELIAALQIAEAGHVHCTARSPSR